MADILGGGAAQQDGPLKDHGLVAVRIAAAAPADPASAGPQEAVAQAQGQTLAGAVGAEDHRARTGGEGNAHIVEQTGAALLIADPFGCQGEDRRGRAHG